MCVCVRVEDTVFIYLLYVEPQVRDRHSRQLCQSLLANCTIFPLPRDEKNLYTQECLLNEVPESRLVRPGPFLHGKGAGGGENAALVFGIAARALSPLVPLS